MQDITAIEWPRILEVLLLVVLRASLLALKIYLAVLWFIACMIASIVVGMLCAILGINPRLSFLVRLSPSLSLIFW